MGAGRRGARQKWKDLGTAAGTPASAETVLLSVGVGGGPWLGVNGSAEVSGR